jgi:hypothetical protein
MAHVGIGLKIGLAAICGFALRKDGLFFRNSASLLDAPTDSRKICALKPLLRLDFMFGVSGVYLEE